MKKTILWWFIGGFVVGIGLGIYWLMRNNDRVVHRVETYELDTTYYLTAERRDSLVLSLEYNYLVSLPVGDSIQSMIQGSIQSEIFGKAFVKVDAGDVLEEYANDKYKGYIQDNEPLLEEWNRVSLKQERGFMFCEELVLEGFVIGMSEDILSYGVKEYAYTGGAHGNQLFRVLNYSLQTGKRVHETDLFMEGYEGPLRDLLVQSLLLATDGVDTEDKLEELGYSVEDVIPNDNFYVSESGLTYVFNPYDIAPYSTGIVEIFLSWKELDGIRR